MMRRRILILGAGKSGTSGLFYCVAASADRYFAKPCTRLFEPGTENEALAADDPFTVAKILLERFRKFERPQIVLDRFDKRVLIVRDPRDSIVSRLVWLVATRLWKASVEDAEAITTALKRKERDPTSIGVLELYRIAAPLTGAAAGARRAAFFAADFIGRGDIHVVRYEDFIERNVADLAGYLGFPLLAEFDMPPRGHRIKRGARAGDWKNWFLPEDHDFFIEPEREKLLRLGYSDSRAVVDRHISPDDVSGYLIRIAETQLPGRRRQARERIASLLAR